LPELIRDAVERTERIIVYGKIIESRQQREI